MKKALTGILIVFCCALLTCGYLVYTRFIKNPEQIFPYPYVFKNPAPTIKLDAPILMAGDQMGAYFAKFETELAASISVNLANPIKIQSIANNGHALHRTLHELRSLVQWPQIIIYQGASEEFKELKFNPKDVSTIKRNFARYQDDRIETALILKPWLSRIIYDPHERIALEEIPQLQTDITEADYLKRIDTELLLFEQQLIQLVNLSRDRNSLLILSTTPINLDIAPKKVCEFSSTIELDKEILTLNELLEANNPKAAYGKSSKLIEQYVGNAKLLYLHGLISKRLGLIDEARNALLKASAFDCSPWRANEVFNSVIRKVAQNHHVILFDFAKLVEEDWHKNVTFFDEIYAQNLYYDKGMKQLGLLIKQILKL
jgi:hypothetical protein